MGVPKFFRYMSERYPCLSEFVKEYEIPEFDNLYLDMNGIIHNCSHPDDGNPHFRITEEKIFTDIFHYIEVLFQLIKPQKVFFMAIDGVAPRAKMNQQRGRRFRTAKDAQKLENEAQKRGETLPEESRFDSNCITPGTEFMANLHEQLQYFVVKKVSEDALWQRCQIILSGHETPGEGEHKIMDFIRYKRSQPGYDPNTRHCLYGLDADLIMLGLCTHDPHFSLLREEVKFGKKSSKRSCVPEEIRFFLLHLSLMREYLEMEFSPLKQSLKTFKFDIEKIIDDWVLMGFLVGNDFIPNLPNLHITNGALPVLYKAYINILPQLDGYINEGGILNLERFEILMKKLGEIDVQNFEEVKDDLLYMEAKTGRKIQPFRKNNTKLDDLEPWKPENDEENVRPEFLTSIEKEREPRDSGLSALIAATETEYLDYDDDESDCDDDDDEFESYKRSYYMNKLEYSKVTREVMKSQAEGYVRAIQWNLHYYYNGVCSWSWYYPHHYAPYISDIKNFQNLKLEYDIGKPFMPYEQLLAVLPTASKELLPQCYQVLMTDEASPIKKYYPSEFDTDLNGKKQEWEAVVLVPFIDEDILLEAMRTCNGQLSNTETERNKHGPMLCYTYTEENLGVYESPKYFPNVPINHAKVHLITIAELRVNTEKLVKGAYPGVLMDVYYPGFPTFKHLQYQGNLKKAKVKVFEQPSRGENMIIQVIPSERVLDAKIPVELLGKTVYVAWPYLREARVVALSNSKEKYVLDGTGIKPIAQPLPISFQQEIEGVTEYYHNRLGIEFGKIIVLVQIEPMIGQKYLFTSTGRISLEKIFCKNTSNYPLQLIVEDINVYSESHPVYTTLESIFPVGSTCFTLTQNEYYGAKGIVKNDSKTTEGRVCVCVTVSDEPDLSKARYLAETKRNQYRTLYVAAKQSGVSNYVFSRITGGFFATAKNREGGLKTVNLGLDLKFNKKNLETPGYTTKINGVWYYYDASVDVVTAYANEFPEIIEYIAKSSYQQNEIPIEDIFPVDSDEKVKAVQTWVKFQAYNQIEKRICDSTVLEKETVEEIENIVNHFVPPNSRNVTLHCRPNLLYKPEIFFGNLIPDPTVEVQLFDRIVNVRANHTVPYGLKGTVVGIHDVGADASNEHMYDVVFDSIFAGGIEINCSNGRGYKLPLNAFINISHGIRTYQPKIGKSDELIQGHAQKEENTNRKYQNYKNSRNTNESVPSNSAFAKFINNPSPNGAQSYNAVPPFMPNGESIYKFSNPSNNRQNYNQQQKHQNMYHSKADQTLDYKNPFSKHYASDSYQGPSAKNFSKSNNQVITAADEPKVPRRQKGNTNMYSGIVSKGNSSQKRADFMPSFSKMTENDPTEETADALKKLLKIDSAKDVNWRSSQSIAPRKAIDQRKSGNDIIKPFKEKIGSQFTGSSSTLPTVQLLSYYQSKGLGLPRYQYVTSDRGIQSQIKLPNRQIIIGTPAKTKEDASEFVADQALKILNSSSGKFPQDSQAKHVKESPKKIPTPPKQWWSQERKVDKHLQPEKHSIKYSVNNDIANNSWKGLIPLQVVKKEKANSSNIINPTVESMNDSNKKNARMVLSEKPGNSSNENDKKANETKQQRPRKQRKMRIAANFGMQPENHKN